MTDITHIFNMLLEQYDSIDIAEAELKKMLADNAILQNEYSEWCHAVGSTEKHGFLDYCEEYKQSQDLIWDSLKSFDE